MKKINFNELVIILLAIALCVIGIIFLEEFYNHNIGGLSQEIFSAVLASIFTVAAMTIVIKLQSKQEKEKEFASKVFEKKILIYQELLQILFKADDDNILDDSEIQSIENKIGEAAIVANSRLVSCFSQFMIQVKIYGCLYPRSMNEKQREHFTDLIQKNGLISETKKRYVSDTKDFEKIFVTIDDLIQGIREDLNVVEGNIKEYVSKFVSMPIDKFSMKRNPNIIDK
jgi:hypothetical protein